MAHGFIENIYVSYEQRWAQMEAEPDNKALKVVNPFFEMETLLSDFFSNEQLTNENCMVPSEDLIKMFEICLADG